MAFDSVAVREAFLSKRRKYLGSSDAAACCGLSPWATPYEVYCDKVYGIRKPETDEMRVGTFMEPSIARMYEAFHGKLLIRPPEAFVSKARPWMAANCDFLEVESELESVEVKNVSGFHADGFGSSGTDIIPTHYMLQKQHQLDVRDRDTGKLVALIGGNDLRVYTVRRSPELVARMLAAEEAVWEMIQKLDPPEPDWSHPTTIDLMKAMAVPSPEAADKTGTDRHAELARQYESMGKQIGDMEKARDAVKAQLLNDLGTSSVMSLPDGRFIRRRPVERAGHVVKPSKYYDFRIVRSVK